MNASEQELIKAFVDYQPFQPIEIEHRIYYDEFSKECILKTTEKPEGTYLVVSREVYESVVFCPNYLIKNGKPELKPVDYSASILLSLSNSGQSTMKGYPMFVVDETYTGPIDKWERKQ